MEKVQIGLVGLGTVGSGVVHLLQENKKIITEETGMEISIRYLVDKDSEKLKQFPDIKALNSYEEMLADPAVDIVVELTGGIDFPWKLYQAAIKAGKHYVTANKALLSQKLHAIFEAARGKKLYVNFEASVAGGIPIIKTLQNYYIANRIISIEGIINGTTNYILTKMSQEHSDFAGALRKAQELGFAEADPAMDINGGDAASKIAILASLAFNQNITAEDVYCEGIDKIELMDIQHAIDLGYTLKLIATCSMNSDQQVEVRVHPTMVGEKNPLSAVKNEYNAILVYADYLGVNMYYGKGAGQKPTASAVVSDIVDIATKITSKKEYNDNTFKISLDKKIKPIANIQSEYYIRVMTKDKPGILGEITTVFGKNKISIATVIQKELGKENVPVLFTTHKALEQQILTSLAAIRKMDFVDSVVFYRILN